MLEEDLDYLPAYELRDLISRKELSPVELTEASLRRIEALNPRINAFLTVAADQALEEARRAEQKVQRGEPLGALHGVPTSIKDLVSTRGIRTTRGSLIYKDWIPDHDDLVVERLRAAGAIILGKTNTPEFGEGGGVTENKLGDYCRNPWNIEMGSGASSGGAAASVAAGITPVAHGTDGAGSIRIPASFCGIFGIMGTQGRVPRRNAGVMSWNPVNFSNDGPLSRTVRDAAIFLHAMSGPHPDAQPGTVQEPPPDWVSALEQGVRGLHIGWSGDLGSALVEPEVRQAFERSVGVFEELGASLEPASVRLDAAALHDTLRRLRGPASHLQYGHLLGEHGDMMMHYVRDSIEDGGKVTGQEYAVALAELHRFRAQIDDYFAKYDLLLTPTVSVLPFPGSQRPTVIDGQESDPMSGWYAFNYPFNMSGNPAATLPCGFSSEGLPIGMQIVGRSGDEAGIFRASAAFEEVRPWAGRRPPLQ